MTEKQFIIDDDGIVTDMVDLSMYIDNEDCCEKLNELAYENEQLKKQLNRLYNYFEDWYSEMTSANDFSEIWDNVKEDERWGDVE